MQPIQVWLPSLTASLADPAIERDMQRAFREWRGELTVWFLPGLKKPYRWQGASQNPFDRTLAIPAERLELVNVCHVNEHGYVWEGHAPERFPTGSVDGLLEIWLNVIQSNGLTYVPAPSSIPLEVPSIKEVGESTEIEYKPATVPVQPCDMLPIVAVDKAARSCTFAWPPASEPIPISPVRESQAYFGPLERHDRDGLPLVICRDNPDMRGIHLMMRWAAPLLNLLPTGGDSDVLLHQATMVEVARKSAENLSESLHEARNTTGLYLSQGWARWDDLQFWPVVVRDGNEGALQEAKAKTRRQSLSWQDFSTVAWQQQMKKRVDITRAWGAIGLFWALLLEQLEQGRRFPECEDCHRLNPGKKGKRFCGPDDDPLCYAQRRARDKRKERGH